MFNPKFIECTLNCLDFIFHQKGLWLLSLDVYLLLYTCFFIQVVRVIDWNTLNYIPILFIKIILDNLLIES